MRQIFVLAFDVPPGATVADMSDYVETAIKSFCGGLDPHDPMFDLERDSVEVQNVKKQIARRIKSHGPN